MGFASVLAATLAMAAPDSTPAASVSELQIVARAPVVGDLQTGVQNFRPEFFTPVRPSNAIDMIKWLPGFSFEDMRDLRGLGGTVGNVLIDGKPPTSKTDTLSTILARIPSNQVERVDVIVGGAPGIDMRGRPVVANIVMKQTPAAKGSITASASAARGGAVFPEVLISGSRNNGGKAWDASLTVATRLLVGPDLGNGTWVRTDAAGAVLFRAEEAGRATMPLVIATGSYEIPFAGGRLRLNGSGRYQHPALRDVAVLQGSGDRYTLDGGDTFKRGELGLRYERTFGGRTTLEAQLLQRLIHHENAFITRRPPVLTDFFEHDHQSESVARATLRFKRDETLTVEGSAEGAFNGMTTGSRLVSAGIDTPIPAANVRVNEDRGEFGALISWKPNQRFGLTMAMKVETSRLTAAGDVNLGRTLSFVKPRAVFSWTPDKATQLRLRLEREVGQIDFFNFVAFSEYVGGLVRAGNPDLRPQRSWVAEAVLERQFWTGASVVLTARHLAIADVVDDRLVGTSGAVGVGNIGDGGQTDLIATLTLPLKAIGLNGVMVKGSLTESRSNVVDPTTGERRPFSRSLATRAELHVAYDLPQRKLNLGFDAFYDSAFTFYRPVGLDGSGGWPRLNLFVEYRVKTDTTVRLEAWNVTDAAPLQFVRAYAGARNTSPLRYADDRRLGVGPYALLKVRSSF